MLTWTAIPWRWIIAGLAVLALVATIAIHFRNDGRVRDERDALKATARDVVLATQAASGNDKVTWETATGQIVALGESNRALKTSVELQNEAIDDLARKAVQAKARAAELQRIADKAQAQRASALRRLSDMALEPGTRDDCLTLLREAEEALDLVKEAAE